MHRLSFVALLLLATQVGFGQTAAGTAPTSSGLPKDPREVIAAARPFYDFSDAALKPWHLKASYQLYDDKGNPTEQGTFEYWWASPQVYRSTWIRGGSMHTNWHIGDGKHAYQGTGEPLKYFEYKLENALLSPLPTDSQLDPAKNTLEREAISLGGAKFSCVMVGPTMVHPGLITKVPMGLFPTYCFDPQSPILRISYSMGIVTTEYNKIVKVQNKYLARDITFYQGKQKILSATVDALTGMSASDAALTPAAEVAVTDQKPVNLVGGISQGMLLKKQIPIYPQDAKDNRVSGTVVLQATIGMDGGIHDLHVVSAPWPSLAASALWSVSHWEYKPYLLNGNPVEVETTVNVVFSIGP
jgi:TonB family protein